SAESRNQGAGSSRLSLRLIRLWRKRAEGRKAESKVQSRKQGVGCRGYTLCVERYAPSAETGD
ncbi:MAG: hypothetical protein V3W37_07240, partial [Candidatus Binatia bacterium]